MSKEQNQTSKNCDCVKHVEQFLPQSGIMIPSKTKKFFRTCIIWQVVRFIAINIKMTILLLKSHH